MATIYIKNLVVKGKHGVYDYEKQQAQRFKINVKLTVDVTEARLSDNLNDTVDYALLKEAIIGVVQDNCFNLMERLADEIGKKILEDKKIQKAILSIEKIDAFETGIPGITVEMSN